MSIEHVPYFYIIQHIPSGKLYGGAKWEEGCNPTTFMIVGGYTTSSDAVNDLILADGLESFKTRLMVTNFGFGMSSYEYETVFLQTNDIANDDNWFNKHNNDYVLLYQSPEYKKNMINKYGVEHPMKSKEIKNRGIETNLKIRGVENPFQCEIIKSGIKHNNLNTYGVEYFVQTEEFKNKSEATSIKKRGVKNSMQDKKVIEYRKIKHLQSYGVEHQSQRKECRDKFTATCIDNFGVDHPAKREDSRNATSKLHAKSSFWNDGHKTFRIPEEEIPKPHWIKGMAARVNPI